MALKYNSNTVDHIINDGHYARELVYNDAVVWEEKYGTVKIDRCPDGVFSITCNRSSYEPTVSDGDIGDGAILYNGDKLEVLVEAENYWTAYGSDDITCTTPDAGSYLSNAAAREQTLDIIDACGIYATRDERSIYVELGEGNNGFEISYTNTQGVAQTKYSYPDQAGGTLSLAYDDVWAGAEATYKIALMNGFNMLENQTGTIQPGYSDINIDPAIYETTWREVCLDYLNSLGTRSLTLVTNDYGQQYTGTADLWPLGGLTMVNSGQGEDDLRISFSITIYASSGKLTNESSNVKINNMEGATVKGYIADSYSSIIYDYELKFDPNDTLTATCVVTAGESITYVTGIEITLTSVQTYTKFPSEANVISATNNSKTIFLYNNSGSGTLYYAGIVDTTSNDIDTTLPYKYRGGIGGYYTIEGASILVGVCEQASCLASPLYWLQI
jgi:hypothetical protein